MWNYVAESFGSQIVKLTINKVCYVSDCNRKGLAMYQIATVKDWIRLVLVALVFFFIVVCDYEKFAGNRLKVETFIRLPLSL